MKSKLSSRLSPSAFKNKFKKLWNKSKAKLKA